MGVGSRMRELTSAAMDYASEAYGRVRPADGTPAPLSWPVPAADLRDLTVAWPTAYQWKTANKWCVHAREGLRRHVRVHPEAIGQEGCEGVAVAHFVLRGTRHEVVFDYSDHKDRLNSATLRGATCYFKFQYRDVGYDDPRVVPGGYPVGSPHNYGYLRGLRRVRRRPPPRFDVFARFGLRHSSELRLKCVELLKSAEGINFRGGTTMVRYYRSLREAAQSRVCLDMPGNGDFCFRLVDCLSIGACVVARRPRTRFPVPLVDREHVVFCADDLSDLVPLCREMIEDDGTRERIGRNAREYFDRYLHRDQLGGYYLSEFLRRCSAPLGTEDGRPSSEPQVVG